MLVGQSWPTGCSLGIIGLDLFVSFLNKDRRDLRSNVLVYKPQYIGPYM